MDYVADGDLEDSETDLPLAHRAATSGDTENLMAAIKADPTVLELQDPDGLTPLSHATMAEQLDSLKLLVKMGASINVQDNLGRTCLAMAAYQGWYEGVVFLLRNGARDHICDKAGRSPLHSATYDTDTRVLTALLQSLSAEEVSQQDNEGMAPLHWACFHNRPQHTKLLLQSGVNVFSHDIDGKTPLHWAAQKGSVACTHHLLQGQHGAALVNTSDFSGKTPLHFAAAAGHSDVIRELSAYHPMDVDCEDPDERTPLHWAAAMGKSEAVSSLLELNANPNPVDLEQGTPLDYARQSGHAECVQILEERLGLRGTNGSVETAGGNSLNQNTEPSKVRKGPLGFIVDFFKPKKAKTNSNDPTDNAQYDNNLVVGDSSYDNNHRLNRPINATGGQHPDRLNTPKKLREPEMLISMEKLQISREDNPMMGGGGSPNTARGSKRDSGYELGQIQPSHSQNVPLGAAARTVLPPRVHDNANMDHSHLIRSPPPTLKRDGAEKGATWDKGKDHGKLEQDAATILALQRERGSKSPVGVSGTAAPPGLTASKSLSPISKGPEAGLYQRRAQTMTPSVSMAGYTSVSPGGDSVSSTRSHPAHLAPLKGPMPPPSPRVASTNPATNPAVHKRLEGLRTEPQTRTPTPPPPPLPSAMPPLVGVRNEGLSISSLASHRTVSIDGSAANPQRKKKKKKKTISIDLRDAQPEVTSSSHRKLGDPYLDAAEKAAARGTSDYRLQRVPPLQATPYGQTVNQ